jgi:hypothetical protein
MIGGSGVAAAFLYFGGVTRTMLGDSAKPLVSLAIVRPAW